MPFDYIALYKCYVTFPELRWHAVLCIYRGQLRIRHIFFFDLEAIFL